MIIDLDAIFILHLSEAKEREENIENVKNFLEPLNVPINIWYTCKKPIYDDLRKSLDGNCILYGDYSYWDHNEYLWGSIFDCVFNHYQILKVSKNLGYKKVLVLEDDIDFKCTIEQLKDYINNIPEDFSICKLHYSTEKDLQEFNINDMYELTRSKIYSTIGYVASKSGMEKYIDLFESKDLFPADLLFRRCKPLYVNKFKICESNANKSYINDNF